jgi:hypothetical protein
MDMKTIKELSKRALDFQVASTKYRTVTSKLYREKENDGFYSIRVALDGQIAMITDLFTHNKIEDSNEKISYQLVLSASMIRTHFIINDLIMSGDIIEALTLIRKQLENLTRIEELNKKPFEKLNRKAPNVFNTLKIGKSFYKELSEVAHFASHKVGDLIKMKKFKDDRIGPTVYPIYSETLNEAYKMHSFVSIFFLFWVIGFIKAKIENIDISKHEKVVSEIFEKAEIIGIFKFNESEE